MSDDRTGRELTPRPTEPEGVVAPRESLPVPTGPTSPSDVRFTAGEQAHTVGLTEERAAQVVRQSGNARMIAFLGVLIFVLFIPIYWLYDIGLPVIGVAGRLDKEADQQYVTDVSRGYALFLANCARCHGDNGQGGVGPPLNDQAKLYKALTDQGLPGTGHLNPNYLHNVLEVGGRYVCGDPNSVMPVWLEPGGPLNYRQVQELITYILASKDTTFVYTPPHAEGGATQAPPTTLTGWTDPSWTPAPGSTPVPACWRDTGATAAPSTPAPVTSPGTPDNPRVIEIEGTGQLSWVDPTTQSPIAQISVVQGETIEFHVVNNSPIGHNFHIGGATELSTAPEHTDLPGLDTFDGATETFTYTVDSLPDQPQFACTVPGHYGTMHGDLVVVSAGGTSASPAAESPAASGASAAPAASGAPSSAAPAESAASSPTASAAP
jgi:mono/diheme cytochrome c family protein